MLKRGYVIYVKSVMSVWYNIKYDHITLVQKCLFYGLVNNFYRIPKCYDLTLNSIYFNYIPKCAPVSKVDCLLR